MQWQFLLYFSILCLIFVKAKSIPDSNGEQQKQYDYKTSPKLHASLKNTTSPKYNEYDDMFSDMPPNFDWRKHEAVTKVKDQKDCTNGDWAFAAVGALEGQLFIKDKNKVELSAQELIDCSNNNGNFGCNGGDIRKAFNYITANGISTEASYPYNGQQAGTCSKKEESNTVAKGAKINVEIISSNFAEPIMKQKLKSNGPILAIIDGSQESFTNYKEGIYQDEKCEKIGKLNVLIVGYGETETDPKEKFWIVKNSWGEDWGEKGYIKIAREKNNTCGIATNTTYIEYSKEMMFQSDVRVLFQ